MNYFENDSWLEINKHCKNKTAFKRYKVGDTKRIILKTGQQIELVIWGINHDILQNGDFAQLTIAMKTCFDTKYKMQQSGKLTCFNWQDCDMRLYTLSSILKLLPNDLSSCIKLVHKSSTDVHNKSIDTIDLLWLPSKIEICGIGPAEGTQYEYWKSVLNGANASDRINGFEYFIRTCSLDNEKPQFFIVNKNGEFVTNDATNTNDLLVCFCV